MLELRQLMHEDLLERGDEQKVESRRLTFASAREHLLHEQLLLIEIKHFR